jgi:hypothetical protein
VTEVPHYGFGMAMDNLGKTVVVWTELDGTTPRVMVTMK